MNEINNLRNLKEDVKNHSEYLEKIKGELFTKYCLKDYKEECEPAYCIFRINKECKFIEEWSKIEDKLNLI